MSTKVINRTILYSIIEECVRKSLANGGSDEAIGAAVSSVLRERLTPLTEMALKRKDYKNKVDALSPQLIENWCLLRHCILYNDYNNQTHWSKELYGHMLTCSRWKMKNDDSFENRLLVLDEVWRDNDYYDEDVIDFVIQVKFMDEGFDVNSKKYGAILMDYTRDAHRMLEAIASRDSNKMNAYVQSLLTAPPPKEEETQPK